MVPKYLGIIFFFGCKREPIDLNLSLIPTGSIGQRYCKVWRWTCVRLNPITRKAVSILDDIRLWMNTNNGCTVPLGCMMYRCFLKLPNVGNKKHKLHLAQVKRCSWILSQILFASSKNLKGSFGSYVIFSWWIACSCITSSIYHLAT